MVVGDYVNRNFNVMVMDGIMVYFVMMGGWFVEKFDMVKLFVKCVIIIGSIL